VLVPLPGILFELTKGLRRQLLLNPNRNKSMHFINALPAKLIAGAIAVKRGNRRSFKNYLLAMNLTAVFMLFLCLQVSAKTHSQLITYEGSNVPLKKVFSVIKEQTGLFVFYNKELMKGSRPVSISAKAVTIENFLEMLMKDQPFDHAIKGNTVVITRKVAGNSAVSPHFTIEVAPPVTGMMRGPDGQVLAGVNILVKGTKKGTVSNADGSFIIDAKEGDVLLISSIGYNSKEVKVTGNNIGEINLGIANAELQEVVVNKGYYTEKKMLNTGNVATVSSKEIAQQPVGNPLAALQGRVPGLEIAQTNGTPGSGFTVQIRGRSSLNTDDVSNDPLYVIDGIQYPSQMPNSSLVIPGGSRNANLLGGSPLNFINVADIESIDVLKDADATAIYGSRGANGVILITTKKGKAGVAKVDLNLYSGIGKSTGFMDMMNTEQYLSMRKEAFKNDGVDIPSTPSSIAYDLTFWDQHRYTDWQKVFFGNTSHYNDLQTIISGGTGNTNYKFGGGYHKESTVFATPGADRKIFGNFSLNTTAFKNKLKAGIVANYTADRNDVTPMQFVTLFTLPPNAPALYNEDGSFNWAPVIPGAVGSWVNPMAQATQTYLGKNNALISNVLVSYTIINDLILQASIGYNNLRTDEITTNPTTTRDPARLANFNASAGYLSSSNTSWMAEPQISYSHLFGNFKLSGLIGSTFREEISNYLNATGSGFSNDKFLSNPRAATTYTIGSYFVKQYKYNAVYGRFNFNFSDKYLINLTGRRDGTSRFGPANHWANFGSLGLAWIFTNESFVKSSLSKISFGKLRMSYGSTGNDQLPDYLYLNLYSNLSTAYAGLKGLVPSGLFNPYLQWEITKKFEIATELGFFRDRVNLITSYYRNRSGNQLVTSSLPSTAGFTSINANLPALVQNSGWEFTVMTNNIQQKNFKWTTSANLSIPKNKLISFDNIDQTLFNQIYIVGQPISSVRVYRTDGIDPTTGVLRILDRNGIVIKPSVLAETQDPIEKTKVINSAPLLSAGFQNSFNYRGFEISFFLQLVKQNALANLLSGGIPSNLDVDYLNRWQKPDDISKYQRYSQSNSDLDLTWANSFNNSGDTDIAWEDGTYVRLKNLYLSYNFATKCLNKLGLNNLRIYSQGQNLFTVTSYSGFDPETRGRQLPPIKVFTIGVQASF
jgi:TonB-dependent starch-binding outer membrane protein SusC